MRNVANSITSIRIILAASLFFFVNYSTLFIIVYTIAWFTDAIDGTIARKTNTVSDFGSKLDDIADTFLGAVMGLCVLYWLQTDLFRFLPIAAVLVSIRIFNVIYTKYKYGKPYVIHTYGNKSTSFIAFLLPIGYLLFDTFFFFYLVLAVGILASLEESIIHIMSDKYNPNKKSLFMHAVMPTDDIIEGEEVQL